MKAENIPAIREMVLDEIKRINDDKNDKTYCSVSVISISAEEKLKHYIEILVSLSLIEIGIPTDFCGYDYLKETVTLCVLNGNTLTTTPTIFPEVAKMFYTDVKQAEQEIQCAIETACEHDNKLMSDLLGVSSVKKAVPNNSEFISALAEKIRLEAGIDER